VYTCFFDTSLRVSTPYRPVPTGVHPRLSFCKIHTLHEMAARSFIAFILLFLCFSLSLIHASEDDTDSTDSGIPTLRVGMVRDLYLRYADQDSTIYGGVVYWVNWVNAQGGFPYPLLPSTLHFHFSCFLLLFKIKFKENDQNRWGNTTIRLDPVQTVDASTPDPKQLNKSINAAYP
jgi:hypothetical protein